MMRAEPEEKLSGRSDVAPTGTETTITKLVYKREWFDLSKLGIGARTVYTIARDGRLTVKEYRGSRRIYSRKEVRFTKEEYNALCENIEACIATADRLDSYVDDTSEELKIYHLYGRVQTVDRGLGNESDSIGAIMWGFLKDRV